MAWSLSSEIFNANEYDMTFDKLAKDEESLSHEIERLK